MVTRGTWDIRLLARGARSDTCVQRYIVTGMTWLTPREWYWLALLTTRYWRGSIVVGRSAMVYLPSWYSVAVCSFVHRPSPIFCLSTTVLPAAGGVTPPVNVTVLPSTSSLVLAVAVTWNGEGVAADAWLAPAAGSAGLMERAVAAATRPVRMSRVVCIDFPPEAVGVPGPMPGGGGKFAGGFDRCVSSVRSRRSAVGIRCHDGRADRPDARAL